MSLTDLESGKVNDIVKFRVFRKDLVERCLVRHVDVVVGWALSGNELDTSYTLCGGVVEVVDDDDVVAGFDQGEGSERTYVASATREVLVACSWQVACRMSQVAIDGVGSVQNTRKNVSDILCSLRLIYALTR